MGVKMAVAAAPAPWELTDIIAALAPFMMAVIFGIIALWRAHLLVIVGGVAVWFGTLAWHIYTANQDMRYEGMNEGNGGYMAITLLFAMAAPAVSVIIQLVRVYVDRGGRWRS